ncbi:MAG: hypothetical protein GQ531_11850 [Sulfurovum sp.]|nr:hypothetical protein [Sulfurovum sp.]
MTLQKTLLNVKNVGLSTLLLGTPLWACNASHVIGAGGSGAVYTMSANTMEKGAFYLGINSEQVNNKSLSDADITNAIEGGAEHLHSIDAINSYSISLSYGISDKLTLNMNLPYSSRKNIRAGEHHDDEAEVHNHGNSDGLGDLAAILQYKIYDVDKTKVALLAGIKAPTGKTDVTDGDEVLEADLQPGSGSWDYFAGVALTHEFENFSFHTSALYKYNTEGVDDSRLGDIFTYNAAISFHLIGEEHDHFLEKEETHDDLGYSVDFFLEFNGEYAKEDRFYGEGADNTGHNIIYLTTGLQLLTEGEYSAFVAFSAPAYQHLEGVQNEIEYKASIGIGKSF